MQVSHTVPQELRLMRHSCAHLMAAAIQSIWPEAKFGVGPATDTGFFYDVELAEPLKESDLERIEQKMRELANKKLPFERKEVPIDDAIETMRRLQQPFKVELLNLLKTKGSTAVAKETGDDDAVAAGVDSVSLYQTGDFTDLCTGPHVANTSQTGKFKLKSIAGAYWRGDAKNAQLQRIHALCFPTKEELDKAIWQLEQAALRDHRKLGKELGIFMLSPDVGSGLPLWLPRGTVIRDELEALAMAEERKDGYSRVSTPHIGKEALFARSGHLAHYHEDMYAPIQIEEERYYLKPMNCPFHHEIYTHRKWSYRELPLRLSEYGQVYRYEASGGLSGLMRVRGFCMNDSHIYCRIDQAKDEFVRVMRLHARYYDLLGIKDYWMRMSLPDLKDLAKYVDDTEGWTKALEIMRQAMDESGYPYVEVEGEAAFYGPKVDFMIKSMIGTEYAISTNQLDFVATKRFDLTYVAEDNTEQPVYVIHRAPLGTHERFTAFLIEQYAGAFPTWLAPVQVMVIPIADRHNDYANEVRQKIFEAPIHTGTGGPRVEVDVSDERMQKKIRNAQTDKIPYMLVVGDKEREAGAVAVRLRNGQDLGAMPIAAFMDRLEREIRTRKDVE